MNAPITKAGNVTCKVGEIVSVPVTTNGFKDVFAITLSLRYNPLYLEYLGTETADEFKLGGPFNDGMLINDYPMNGVDFRCVACAWYKLGKGITQVENESLLYHKFRAKATGTANLVWVNKSIKNPQTTCEWASTEDYVWNTEHTQIIDMPPMDEPEGTYINGTVTIL